MDDLVGYEVRDGVAVASIDNGKANALSPAVLAELDACLTRAEEAGPSEVGALVVTGRPGIFSGGFDLSVMRGSPSAAIELVTQGGTLFTRLFASPVPVIGAASGHAIAGGALLLLGCDYRVGASGAFRIGLIETEIGMVLPRWAIELSRERLSPRQFQQATVGAKVYEPGGAVEAGFLDAVVEPDALLDAAVAEAQRWGSFPRAAYAGQVRANRGERLGRLADALDSDRQASSILVEDP